MIGLEVREIGHGLTAPSPIQDTHLWLLSVVGRLDSQGSGHRDTSGQQEHAENVGMRRLVLDDADQRDRRQQRIAVMTVLVLTARLASGCSSDVRPDAREQETFSVTYDVKILQGRVRVLTISYLLPSGEREVVKFRGRKWRSELMRFPDRSQLELFVRANETSGLTTIQCSIVTQARNDPDGTVFAGSAANGCRAKGVAGKNPFQLD